MGIARIQRHGKIIQVQEITCRKVGVFALSIYCTGAGNDREGNIRKVHDLFDIRSKPLLLLCHIAVSFQAGRFAHFAVVFPFAVPDLESVDFFLFVLVEIINCMDRIVLKIKIRRHRMQLGTGIPAVSCAIPALQLVAEHEKECKRMLVHPQRSFIVFTIKEGNGKLEKTVVQQDCRQSVHVLFVDLFDPDRVFDLTVEPRRAEIRMIHEIVEGIRRDGLVVNLAEHIFFRKVIRRAELLGDAEGKKLLRGFKRASVNLYKLLLCLLSQLCDRVHIPIGEKQAALAALPARYLVVREHLLKRKLKGIADIMEQRRQPPVFQKTACRRMVNICFCPVRIKAIEAFEACAEGVIGFVDRQSQRKNVDRMGIVIAVLHEQRTAVGLELGEQLHHLFRFAVMPEEHFQIAVINGVGVLRRAGIDEFFEFAFQTQAIYVHLHIVWNLTR